MNLDKALECKTDLDLLISRKDILEFLTIITSLGFKRIKENLFGGYPAIEHYFCYDIQSDCFVHLHVHYRLIYGFKNLKDFHLPIERFLLNNRKKDGICYIPKPEIELFFYTLRLLSKFRYRDKVKLFFQPKISDKEFVFLSKKIDLDRFSSFLEDIPINIESSSKAVFLKIAKGEKISRSDIKKITKFNNRFRRKNRVRKTFEIFAKRIIFKLLSHPKKLFASGGITIAFVGIDGSGKTTIIKKIYKKFSKKFEVSHYYMGGKKNSFNFFNRIFYYIVRFCKIPVKFFDRIFRRKKNNRSIFTGLLMLLEKLIEYFFAKNRLLQFRKGVKDAANGKFVIFERFPLKNSVDYYKFGRDYLSDRYPVAHVGMFSKMLDRRINNIYDRIYLPDKMFHFQINDLSILKKRRPWLSEKNIKNLKIKNDSINNYFNNSDWVIKVDAQSAQSNVKRFVFKNIWDNL